ncbi:MAG TPA: hypothetical protein VLS94_06990, partial [Fusibacter sp.]|nr:hypothetical protein [Fusibacter sp.]
MGAVVKTSKLDDRDDRDRENRIFENTYNEQQKVLEKEKKQYQAGMIRAYTLIKEQFCTRDMQRAVEALPDFRDKIYDDPLELLKAIKILTSVPVRATKDWISLHEHLKLMINIQQRQGEDEMEYVNRFRQYRSVVKGFMGTKMFDEFVKNTKTYQDGDADTKKKLLESAWEEATAIMCLNGANRALMGATMTAMATEFTSDIDRYPKTVEKVLELLTVTKSLSIRNKESQKSQNNHRDPRKQDKNKESQQDRDDDKPSKNNEASFAQRGQGKRYECNVCGSTDHHLSDCTKLTTIPKDQWHIVKKTMTWHNEGSKNDSQKKESKKGIKWNG